MCTGNSCRSILGEALINRYLDGVEAMSCGTEPAGAVNPHARAVLEAHGDWSAVYHSKGVESVIDVPFDLVVTVCDHAREVCPVFPRSTLKLHVGFEDPDGKPYAAFEATYAQIKAELLPAVAQALDAAPSSHAQNPVLRFESGRIR
jgi:arsenate reductase